jgi:DNA-3-methyladenine glycosylase
MRSSAKSRCHSTKLLRAFYARPAEIVARELIGKVLIHRTREREFAARIVETEAYLGPHDLAAHSRFGKTKRNEVMFGPAGFAYVYLIYGIYDMFNVVTGEKGEGSAVLIRAGEPLKIKQPDEFFSCRGPGKFAQSMHITRRDNAEDLCGDKLFFCEGTPIEKIKRAKRVGVDYAGHWKNRLLRFYDPLSRCVSKN